MAAAVDSAGLREEILPAASPARLSALEAWHLLSLDAPTVAALWAWFFARAMRIHLPWHAPLLLALGTWLIYVADRILDGLPPRPFATLRLRHYFHIHHRTVFLSAAMVVTVVLLWLICVTMSPGARRDYSVLFGLTILYLFLVHNPASASRAWLLKEPAVGAVFAAATAVPAWSRLEAGRLTLLPAVTLFALLCWLNCVAIERWECTDRNGGNSPLSSIPEVLSCHPGARWAVRYMRPVALGLAVLAAIMTAVKVRGHLAPDSANTPSIYLAVLASALCLALLDGCRRRLSTTGVRVAADAALLTPLLFLPFAG